MDHYMLVETHPFLAMIVLMWH